MGTESGTVAQIVMLPVTRPTMPAIAPASLLYVKARSEHGRRLFSPAEIGLFALIVIGGIIGAIGLWTGRITI